jgi:hypothetical protein
MMFKVDLFICLCVFLFIYLFTRGDATNNQDSKKKCLSSLRSLLQ